MNKLFILISSKEKEYNLDLGELKTALTNLQAKSLNDYYELVNNEFKVLNIN